jgi:hypothetical protein
MFFQVLGCWLAGVGKWVGLEPMLHGYWYCSGEIGPCRCKGIIQKLEGNSTPWERLN